MPSKIKTLRKKLALSQRELAAKAGITAATLNRIETGKESPMPKTIRALAAALGVSPADIAI